MALPTKAYGTTGPKNPLAPFSLERREPGPRDVLIKIHYCGVCHSDVHQARNEWGISTFPMVPGHEIAGVVERIGNEVKKFQPGDHVGVGCFVDSCRSCSSCEAGLEQYCEREVNWTYNGVEKDGKTPTFGGYSTQIVVDENYVLKIPENLPLEGAAPLLCAGITTFSPLKHWGVGPGKKVAVVGLGGLGHMAVKLAAAMGAEVAVISHSEKKKSDALGFGAKDFYSSSDPKTFENLAGRFDVLINTVSVQLDWNQYLELLKRDGALVLLGIPPNPPPVHAFSLIRKRRSLTGSLIGGIQETQEMLDFCGQHNIVAQIEKIPMEQINEAYERMIQGKVQYRFVIDVLAFED